MTRTKKKKNHTNKPRWPGCSNVWISSWAAQDCSVQISACNQTLLWKKSMKIRMMGWSIFVLWKGAYLYKWANKDFVLLFVLSFSCLTEYSWDIWASDQPFVSRNTETSVFGSQYFAPFNSETSNWVVRARTRAQSQISISARVSALYLNLLLSVLSFHNVFLISQHVLSSVTVISMLG